MADLKISQLPLTQTLIPNDVVPIVSQASTKQTMLSSLSAFVATDLYQSDANLLALFNQADADLLTLMQTTSSDIVTSPGIAKAWVNFNGTGTTPVIRSSYNVSSVTKNGTGDYTVTFAAAMNNNSYSCKITVNTAAYGGVEYYQGIKILTYSTASVRIQTGAQNTIYGPALIDNSAVNVVIFGN